MTLLRRAGALGPAVLTVAVAMGLRVSGEQPPATANPCVEKGDTNPQLLPVDDAASKPDFLQFRERLRNAVERRDVDAVVEASDPAITLGFSDASEGPNALRTLLAEHVGAGPTRRRGYRLHRGRLRPEPGQLSRVLQPHRRALADDGVPGRRLTSESGTRG